MSVFPGTAAVTDATAMAFPCSSGAANKSEITAPNMLPALAAQTTGTLTFATPASDSRILLSFPPRHPTDSAAFNFCAQETLATGIYDYAFQLGHNVDASGSRVDATKGSILWSFEQRWRGDANTDNQEAHLIFKNPAGTQSVRVMSFNHNNDPSDVLGYTHYSIADRWQYWLPADSTVWYTIAPGGFTLTNAGASSSLALTLNSTGATLQAAGSANRSLAFNANGTGTISFGAKLTVDPTNALITLDAALDLHNSLGITGDVTLTSGNINMVNTKSITAKATTGSAGAELVMDNANNASFRNTHTAGDSFYGNASASNAGNVKFTAKGSIKLTIDQNGVTNFLPDAVNSILKLNSTGVGFFAVTPVARSTGWAVTNVTPDKVFDANATTLDELADVLGTLITYLLSRGDLSA